MEIINWLLFIPVASSSAYIIFFSFFSHLLKIKHYKKNLNDYTYLVIFPAYAEDNVIIESVISFLKQNYKKYELVVVSDHMKKETNEVLNQLPIHNIIAGYDNSSKAKALQLCFSTIKKTFDYVVILDADNIVENNFLTNLNSNISENIIAYQCHRTAKNTNTSVAILDACSEEINNTIFRLSHNKIGLPSALIGSGMCIKENWFRQIVFELQTTGEDKEIEAYLLSQKQHILYLPKINVYDEKVQSSQNFGQQRKRWIGAQINALINMTKQMHWNKGYIDKVIQQTLIPKSICLCFTLLMTVITLRSEWCLLSLLLGIALVNAIPSKLLTKELLFAVFDVPGLVFRMIISTFYANKANKEFIHTRHAS